MVKLKAELVRLDGIQGMMNPGPVVELTIRIIPASWEKLRAATPQELAELQEIFKRLDLLFLTAKPVIVEISEEQ